VYVVISVVNSGVAKSEENTMNRLELAAILVAAGAVGAAVGPSISVGSSQSSASAQATLTSRVQRLEASVAALKTQVGELTSDLNAARKRTRDDEALIDKTTAIHNCTVLTPLGGSPLAFNAAGGTFVFTYTNTPDCKAAFTG
jgi:outer membrane murein-binding lipoprotein Lpp